MSAESRAADSFLTACFETMKESLRASGISVKSVNADVELVVATSLYFETLVAVGGHGSRNECSFV